MTLIREFVSYDQDRVSRTTTDLLSFYESPKDAVAVAKSFLFSVSSDLARPLIDNERYDSLEILWYLLTSFDRAQHPGTDDFPSPDSPSDGMARNRLLVIGGYGWGKSSLALVAGCFLGLPSGEEGHEAVVAALDPDSSPATRQLVDKRLGQKCKFTVCLKGKASDFRSLLVTAVSKSKSRYRDLMEQHGFAINVPCEYEAAAAWLQRMNEVQAFRDLAESREVRLADLLSSLRELQSEALSLADELFWAYNQLHNHERPPWYEHADTGRYLTELVTSVTGHSSPFDGVLVLFDEIGLWLEHANERSTDAGVASFLQFMETAQNSWMHGKLTVCSFIQFDVEAFIGRESAAQNVRHANKRMGVRVRYRPDLELVFQSAIKQRRIPADFWKSHDQEVAMLSGLLVRGFQRYSDEPWDRDTRRLGNLVRKCWPIHPLMVASVCHLRFGEGHRVISILESQFDKLLGRPSEDADGNLAWSLPVDVVDFFEANFENVQEHTRWDQYQHARTCLRLPDADPRSLVLKAVFLCHALQEDIQLDDPDDFPVLVARLAGCGEAEAAELLRELSQPHGTVAPVLLHNDVSGWYEFFAPEQNPAEARRELIRAFEVSDAFDLHDEEVNESFTRNCPFSPKGFAQRRFLEEHSYQAWHQSIIDARKVTEGQLVDLVKRHVLDGADPSYRGVHVIVLYSTAKPLRQVGADPSVPAVDVIRDHCRLAINAAWQRLRRDGTPVPLAVSYPVNPPDDLYRSLALLSCARGLKQDQRDRMGQGLQALEVTERKAAKSTVDQRHRGWTNMQFLLPDVEGDEVLAGVRSAGASAKDRLLAFYMSVYSSRPPLNHSVLGSTGNSFVKYCRALLSFLSRPTLEGMHTEHVNALQSVLLSSAGVEDRNWMTVEESGGAYHIVVPDNPLARTCYQYFDEVIRNLPESKRTLKEVWKRLSPAPYGLDARSFVLLFGIWYALNREGCELIESGARANGDRVWGWDEVLRLCESKSTFFDLFKREP